MSTHNVCFDEVLIVQEQETEGKALKKKNKKAVQGNISEKCR